MIRFWLSGFRKGRVLVDDEEAADLQTQAAVWPPLDWESPVYLFEHGVQPLYLGSEPGVLLP